MKRRIVWLVGALVIGIAGYLLFATYLQPKNGTAPAKDPAATETIVEFENDQAKKDFQEQNNLNEDDLRPSGDNTYVVPKEPDEVQQTPGSSTQPNYIYKALYTPNDTNYGAQWNLAKISASQAWDISRGSSSQVIAVIDTGALFSQTFGTGPTTYTQPDFPDSRRWENAGEKGATALEGATPNCTSRGITPIDKSCNNRDDDDNGYIDDWQGWDFMGGWRGNSGCPNFNDPTTYEGSGSSAGYIFGDTDPAPYSCDNPTVTTQLNKDHYSGGCNYGSGPGTGACYIGHGTMVASTAASESNNGQLIAGVDHFAKIMNLRTLDGYGFTDTITVKKAVDYAVGNGATVINLSLAVNDCTSGFVDTQLETSLANAKTSGVVVVAAAGNTGGGIVCYPASSTNAIAVGATNSSDNKASFSSYGTQLDVVAPGVDIPVANAPSAQLNSNYSSTADGTSFSAPHVAGLVSLIQEQNPTATPAQIEQLLKDGADKVAGMNGAFRTDQYGFGRINAARSLAVYKWQIVSQTYGSTPTTYVDGIPMSPGETQTVTLTVKNVGNVTWSKTTNPVRLATWLPTNHTSQFDPGDWVIGGIRPALLTEDTVAPGANGTFTFNLKAPGPGNYGEYYNLVAEGASWFMYDDPFVSGSSFIRFNLNVTGNYRWELVDQVYGASSTDYIDGIPASPGDTVEVTVTVKNIGDATWFNSGSFPIRIATWLPTNHPSLFYPGSGWTVDSIRPATLNESTVPKNSNGTFTFNIKAPGPGNYGEYYNLVAEGASWFPENGIIRFNFNVAGSYRWEIVNQTYGTGDTPYVDGIPIQAGTTEVVKVTLRNIGTTTWRSSGNPVRLATFLPTNRVSPFYPGSGWVSGVPDGIRPAQISSDVAPNGEVTLSFNVKAPNTPGSNYGEYFNLVAEGIAWFGEDGINGVNGTIRFNFNVLP